VFGLAGVVSGEKLFAGALGLVWGCLASVGAYELNRRRFGWHRGSKYSDRHLLAGTLAVASGLIISGALHETMPALAILPAVSAIMQANEGHEKRYLATIHSLVLVTGVGIALWLYNNSIVGKILIERINALP
jgi:hypothetical protein